MKKIYLLFYLVLAVTCLQAQNNVGIGTNTPNASAKLDITATDKGLLIPRVNLSGTGDVSTIASPATGLMVFNQTAAGSGATAVTANTFYYWNSSKWVKLEASLGDDWIKANTATTQATKTDDQYVTGSVGVGDFSASSPSAKVDINAASTQAALNVNGTSNPEIRLQNASSTKLEIGIPTAAGSYITNSVANDVTFRQTGGQKILFSSSATGATNDLALTGGNVGIGTVSPTNATLHVNTLVGNTAARFGSTNPLYVIANYPHLGFNTYFNGGWKYGTANYAGIVGCDPTSGKMFISNTATSGAADAAATFTERLSIDNTGAVTVNNLSGTGNRPVFSDANGVLKNSSATNDANWTVASNALYSTDDINSTGTTCSGQPAGSGSSTTFTNVTWTGGSDDAYTVQNLGFTFYINGTAYTQVTICSNGFLQFGSTTTTAYSNTILPSASFSEPTLCYYWDDMYIAGSSRARTASLGDAGNKVWILDCTLQPFWSHNGSCGRYTSCQVHLYERSNLITVTYYSMDGYITGQSATIGLQINSTTAINLSCNAKILEDNAGHGSQFISFSPSR